MVSLSSEIAAEGRWATEESCETCSVRLDSAWSPPVILAVAGDEDQSRRAKRFCADGANAATRLKDMLACPDPLFTDDAGDPELCGLKHALLFQKLPCPAHKGNGLFQAAPLLEEELLQLR